MDTSLDHVQGLEPGVPGGLGGRLIRFAGLIAATVAVLWLFVEGFFFLRDSELPRLAVAGIAVVWALACLLTFYFAANGIVRHLPLRWAAPLQPFVFIGPAIAMVTYFLAFPAIRTIIASFYDRDGTAFVGLANYIDIFTQSFMLETFRNNLMWIVFGASFTVIIGLVIAALADRSGFERLAKAVIFMPMAISLVGAGIIWKFVYAVRDVSDPQIGLLNAIVVALGGEPQAWIALLQPWNNLFLIVIVVWMQTGFAMVLFSAAIKGVPGEIVEAARVDGASEVRIFFQILIPSIKGTIITVSATIMIFTLKIFDVVIVMTGGQYGTSVIATEFYNQYFVNRNFGLGSAIAVVLLLTVSPFVIYNVRQLRQQRS